MEIRCHGCMQLKENSPICEHCGYDERSQNNSHQLPAGTLVGNQYILGRVLGQGGFGITYIGWDNVLQQRVAVKEYFPSGYAGRDVWHTLNVTSYDNQDAHAFEANKHRFLREAESLAKLWNIPQIVKVLRHFEENGTAYIAMEFAEGEELRRYLQKLGRPMTMEEVMEILGPIMEALVHVHNADLVHRDISPDNIMVLPDGSAKLLDFGAARYVENADAGKDRNTSTQAILKHGFAPPEQYRSHGALGPWTDVYAVCATVYFCLTGRIPPEAMSRMMGETELTLTNVPGLTAQQREALEKGMHLIPKMRTGSVLELYQQLFCQIPDRRTAAQQQTDQVQSREPESAQPEARKTGKTQQNQSSPQKKKGKLFPLIGAASALVAVAVGFFLIQPPKPANKAEMAVPAVTETAATTASVETIAAETTVPEPTKVVWWDNVLIPTHTQYKDEDLVAWWQEHQYNYPSPDAVSSHWVEYNGQYYLIHEYALTDFLGTLPLYDSHIPRGSVTEVFFLDSLIDAPENAWDVSADQNRSVMAWITPTESEMFTLYIAGEGGINGIRACENLFYGFCRLEQVHFDGNFHTEDVTSMERMFYGCSHLLTLDLSSFNTSNVTNMYSMFRKCSRLMELDLSGFNTSNVTTMANLFYECSKLTKPDLGSFNTSGVMSMSGMFYKCSGLTELDLSGFDTSNVTDMGGMFFQCSSLAKLDLSGFDTSNVRNMRIMFSGCFELTELDLSGFDTSNVTDKFNMFYGCNKLPDSVKAIAN